jgi:hypothetical protein
MYSGGKLYFILVDPIMKETWLIYYGSCPQARGLSHGMGCLKLTYGR